jgi:hypothetical protein
MFEIEGIQSFEMNQIESRNYLILLHVDQTPPHLMLSLAGKVYGVSSEGKQNGTALQKLLTYIERKKTPSLFIELICSDSPEELATKVATAFSKYPRLIAGKTSCLSPIRDFAVSIWGNQLNEANFVFELIPLLENEKAIGTKMGLNCVLDSDTFQMAKYNSTDISKNILTQNSLQAHYNTEHL